MFQHPDLVNRIFLFFFRKRDHGLPADFYHPATSLHAGNSVHCHHGQGNKPVLLASYIHLVIIHLIPHFRKYDRVYIAIVLWSSVTSSSVSFAWFSPGGCGTALRGQTYGTTADLTMKPRCGFVSHQKRQVVPPTHIIYPNCSVLDFSANWDAFFFHFFIDWKHS